MISKGQNDFYWRLWGAAKKAIMKRSGVSSAEAEKMRHELHAKALGKDKSHTEFSNRDFDLVKAVFLAESQPANMDAQIDQEKMDRTRRIWVIQQLTAALDENEPFVETILKNMNRELALGGPYLRIDQLTFEQLEKLIIALKKECRRRWPKKCDLLGAIRAFCQENEVDQAVAGQAVCKALCRQTLPRLDSLDYDRLVIVLAALKPLTGIDIPF